MKAKIVIAMLMLGGCTELPIDPEGTMERVRGTKVLRAGMIATGNEVLDPPLGHFLNLLASDTGSRPQILPGSTETLLPMLEKGKLDIVVGHLAPDTPWATRVTILPSPQEMKTEDGEPARAAVVRNGENAWVALVYRHAPALKEQPR